MTLIFFGHHTGLSHRSTFDSFTQKDEMSEPIRYKRNLTFRINEYLAGDDIVDHLDEMLEYFDLEGIDFQKVGVESDNIKYHFDKLELEYNGDVNNKIPTIPAKPPKTNKPKQIKAWRTRVRNYKYRRGSDATIQLDGFLAVDRKAFENLVVGAVDKWFNPEIYKEYQSELAQVRSSIPRLARKKAKELSDELNDQ
jgi:hypothetical protein